jgi:hypothetical protein
MFSNLFDKKRGLEAYKKYLGPRYETFLYAFEEFRAVGGKTVVELGTSRSFVRGGQPGCMDKNRKYWKPRSPRNWDWGAGLFTRMCALHLQDVQPEIHSVDISADAIEISKVVTADFARFITHHLTTSEEFLDAFDKKIDLLYMDTGETGAEAEELHLREARIVLTRQLMSPKGIIVIDDVNVPGNTASKGRFSIPLFCQNGFQIAISDYQVVLRRTLPAGTRPGASARRVLDE